LIKASEVAPEHPGVFIVLAEACDAAGLHKEAAAAARRAIQDSDTGMDPARRSRLQRIADFQDR